jgi:hypothetical protein
MARLFCIQYFVPMWETLHFTKTQPPSHPPTNMASSPQKLILHVNPHHAPKVATNLVEDWWLLCFGIRVHARLSMRVVLWEVVIMSTMASQVPPASTTIHCAVGNRISWHIRNIWRVRRRCTHEYRAAQFVWVNILKPFLPARPKTNLADVVEDDGSMMSMIRIVIKYVLPAFLILEWRSGVLSS